MDYPIPYPGFEGRGLLVRVPGVFSNPKVVVDGTEVQLEKERFQVRDNKGEEVAGKLKHHFLDSVPKVEMGGKTVELAPPLPWYAYVWSALPLLLIFLGGLVGAICGAVAWFANARIFRSERATFSKYVITGGISILAAVAYVFVAGFIYGLVHGA